ncbi:MAG: hypothetical protein ACLFTV_00485 [Desulfococcaceae bacterium]
MQYDIASKVLIDRCRDDIIRYLLDIPVRESRILEPLPQETVSLKRGDYPIMITDESGGQEMAIIEIYAEWDKLIPLHLIDYRVRHKIQHGVEAVSCVILLRPSGSATDRYKDRELRFRFRLVKIYEMDARRVVSEGPLCMLPFVPLMKGGEAALDEAEELVYRSEKTRPEKADMLTSMAILSGLVSAELPARLIARRKDIMIESAAYDIIKKEGFAEGRKTGREEGHGRTQ